MPQCAACGLRAWPHNSKGFPSPHTTPTLRAPSLSGRAGRVTRIGRARHDLAVHPRHRAASRSRARLKHHHRLVAPGRRYGAVCEALLGFLRGLCGDGERCAWQCEDHAFILSMSLVASVWADNALQMVRALVRVARRRSKCSPRQWEQQARGAARVLRRQARTRASLWHSGSSKP